MTEREQQEKNLIAGTQTLTQEQQDELLEKFDTESKVRKFSGKNIALFVSAIAILYSIIPFIRHVQPDANIAAKSNSRCSWNGDYIPDISDLFKARSK